MSISRWLIAPASCPTRIPPTSSASLTALRGQACPRLRLLLHEGVEIRCRDRAVEIGEGPLLLDLLGGFQKAGHGSAIERGGEADALDSHRFEFRGAERAALYANHEV